MADMGKLTTTLRASLAGGAVVDGDAAYEGARHVFNALIDKRPAVIATCLGTADVQAAVRAAREHNLEMSVRGGGHNVAGTALCHGGLAINLTRMRGVLVDPSARRARAQAGATWGDYNRETQVYGLASTGGVVSTTGVAGLTLGGGLGWLMSSQGLAADTLRAAEIVTASGDVLRVSADEHPDLFWALRGGGGNFGVVTSFDYEVKPVGPIVIGGLVAHPLAAARDVLRFYRDVTASLPDDLGVFAGLVHAPDGSGAKLVAIVVCHIGDVEAAARAIEPIRRFGSPVLDAIGPMPYSVVNTLFDAGFPWGALNYWKANFLRALSDEAIDTAIDAFAACPSPMNALFLEHFHGAVSRVDPTATAFPHRTPGYNQMVIGVWTDPADTAKNIAWVRNTYAALAPQFAQGRYMNYLNVDEVGQTQAEATFGPNAARLREVKRRYDPDNVFHLNHNIVP